MRHFLSVTIALFVIGMQDDNSWQGASALPISINNQINILDDKFAVSFLNGFGSEGVIAVPVQGGFTLVGNAIGLGNQDILAIKTDSSGITLWENKYDFGIDDKCTAAIPTSDGGLALCVNSHINYSQYDALIIKLSTNGTVQWASQIGSANNDERLYSICQTPDGGYIAAGYRSTNLIYMQTWIIKLDALGSSQWENMFYINYISNAYSILSTSDGSYIATGRTLRTGTSYGDMYLLKLDASGNLSWCNTYGDLLSDEKGIVVVESYWGYLISWASDTNGLLEGGVLHVDYNGSFTRPGLDFYTIIHGVSLSPTSMIQASDGSYVLSGNCLASNQPAIALIKLNPLGAVSIQKYYSGRLQSKSGSVIEINRELLWGATYYFTVTPEMWLIRTGLNGEINFNPSLAQNQNLNARITNRTIPVITITPLSVPTSLYQGATNLIITPTYSRKMWQAP
ncbi:MAG: hypothetical protein HY606_15375 [Planctomycetes bacterium]|nr:hypothetical protein [Planctomycetota bacterium]